MTFFSNLSSDWFRHERGHVARPQANPNAFVMPNSTSPYPPTHPNHNIISSSCSDPQDQNVYSGVEPLVSINRNPGELSRLFNGTTVPETAAIVYNPNQRPRKQYNKYQKQIHMGVEYYGTLQPNLWGVDRYAEYRHDPWSLPMIPVNQRDCCKGLWKNTEL